MSRVGILTDTTSSIPQLLAEELQIEMVPYHVMRQGENLRDLMDVKADAFAAYLRSLPNHAKLPTTSFPSPGEYLDALRKLAESTREIVVLTMTSKGSGAYGSCRNAVEMLQHEQSDLHIEIVDTLQVAMAHGWSVIEAARAAKKGASLAQVVERARVVASKAMMVQTADTLRYLYMGGRIGRAQHLMANLLDIKPLIGMHDGVIVALGTARTRTRAYARMIELVRAHIRGARMAHLAFVHCGVPEQAELLRDLYFQTCDCIEEMTTPLSPVLAVHSGPGTAGICLFAE